ncbi:MAG: hypothetical protein HYS78_01305 [Parcubacteria group bacterium]|nr:hypothetical protein [Parcubacteria group bacterium]
MIYGVKIKMDREALKYLLQDDEAVEDTEEKEEEDKEEKEEEEEETV